MRTGLGSVKPLSSLSARHLSRYACGRCGVPLDEVKASSPLCGLFSVEGVCLWADRLNGREPAALGYIEIKTSTPGTIDEGA